MSDRPMTDYERGLAEGLRMAAEVCRSISNTAWANYKTKRETRGDPHWQGVSNGCDDAENEILSLRPEGADQRGAAAVEFSPSRSHKHTAQSASHQNPGEQGSESSRTLSEDSPTRASVVGSPARPGPFVMVPRDTIDELLEWFDKPIVKHDQGLPDRFRSMLHAAQEGK